MKEHSCTDNLKQLTPATESSSTNDGNRKGHITHSGKDKNDFGNERKIGENNEIRKTYLSNTQGLIVYKFRKLLRENNLHEVSIHGNRYCFMPCIIITLAEHGINKTLEVLSTKVMMHIRQKRDNFYSSFKKFSIEEEEAEKALQKQNKGNTAITSSRIVKPVVEPQEGEAEKSSQKQNKNDASSSVTQKLQSSSSTQGAEDKKS